MTDDQKKLLENSGFDVGVEMSKIHADCPEWKDFIERVTKLIVEIQDKIFDHHENCPKR